MQAELAFAALCFVLIASFAAAGRVRVLRDEWGVPHIFADRFTAACYGFGWAQAEDRLEQLLRNYRHATGTMSEAFGEEHVEHDWQCRLLGHQEVSKRRYPELPADMRAAIEAFQAGVKDYMEAHPDEVPEWAPRIEPWMVVAIGRSLIFNWPVGRAYAELERRDEVDLGFSSNQWAVGPQRSALGCAILCIDPHIPWDGPFRFYEFRMHAGDLHLCGFAQLGSPVMGLGHSDHHGWASTTGGPDTTDIYVEETNPDDPRQYRYDGEWRDMTVRPVAIEVKGAEAVTREVEYTHHGPIILREGNRAYAMACPYLEEVDLITQLYRMSAAKSLDEFREALAMLQLMEQNIMYADVEGNLFYLRNGRVPVRPRGFDFSKPVPGNTGRTEWMGLHEPADLVQLENPERGYMQNCNIGPDTMMVDCPLKPDAYPGYVYNEAPGMTHSRGRRANELLEAAEQMTVEQAIAITLDVHAEGVEQCQAAARQAGEGVSEEQIAAVPGLKEGLEAFLAWDGHLTIDAPGATFHRALREAARDESINADADAIRRGEDLSAEQRDAVRQAVVAAVKHLNDTFGKTVIPWGDAHRVRRGDKSWPMAGGDGGGGQSLRAIGTEQDDDGILYGVSGQSWTQLVILEKGKVRSFSATPYGQSDHLDSPHYTDQAEKLYSKLRMKDARFMPDSLEGHVESETELEWGGQRG